MDDINQLPQHRPFILIACTDMRTIGERLYRSLIRNKDRLYGTDTARLDTDRIDTGRFSVPLVRIAVERADLPYCFYRLVLGFRHI